MNKNIRSKIKKLQQGFTLLESMLALFVLTIGLLGVAGMHMRGMESSNIAIQRMTASIKAHDMLERIRANSTSGAVAIDAYAATAPTNNGCNSGTVCTAAQMVAHDLFMWNTDLRNSLPGNPVININIAAPLVTVSVQWTDRGDAHSYTVSTRI